MTQAIVYIGVSLVLYWASKPFMLAMLSQAIIKHETFESFMKYVLLFVYANVALVFVLWYLFAEAAMYVIAFTTFNFLILLRFDFDDTGDEYKSVRKELLDLIELKNKDL